MISGNSLNFIYPNYVSSHIHICDEFRSTFFEFLVVSSHIHMHYELIIDVSQHNKRCV